MEHAIVYHGKFDLNRPQLRPATSTLVRARDHTERPLPRTRAEGIKFGYMEVVRDDDRLVKVGDVVLGIPVRIDRFRHARGKKGAPSPRIIDDDAARRLLDDALYENPQLRRALKGAYDRLGVSVPSIRALRADRTDGAELPDVDDVSATEGGRRLRVHLAIERNRSLVRRKKADVRARTGRLACEACNFDFARKYPSIGADFCEVHHRKGLAARRGRAETRLVDLAIVCSNCHRMIHRTKPMMTVDAFRALIRVEV